MANNPTTPKIDAKATTSQETITVPSPTDKEFEDSKSQAISELSNSQFDNEIKKEFGQIIKKSKNMEDLQDIMKGFINFIANKLKSKTDKEKTPREESKLISEGESDPKHIGLHTQETFGQELISLAQTNPMFRTTKWKKRCAYLKKALIESKLKKSDIRPLLYEMERIENQR